MPGSQFIHVNGYALKASRRGHSIADIVAEVKRQADACPHVASALPPRLRYGQEPEAVLSTAAARIAKARDRRGRRLPEHTIVVFAAVVSYPVAWASCELSNKDLEFWIARNIEFFQKLWGDSFICGIEHLDETFPHLHCFAVAPLRADNSLDLEAVSQMHAAQAAVRHAGGGRREQRLAFCTGARSLQNDYFDAVALPCGLTRMGPARLRLSRRDWRSQKEAAAAEARRLRAAEREQTELRRQEDELARWRDELTRRRDRLAQKEEQLELRVQAAIDDAWASYRTIVTAANDGRVWFVTDPVSGRTLIETPPDVADSERTVLINAVRSARPLGLFKALRIMADAGALQTVQPSLRM